MLKLELLSITELDIRYKYYPEDSDEYGIVTLKKLTKDRNVEKQALGYSLNYAMHAIRRLEEYYEKNSFPEKDIVAWY